jgi:nucleoside-diphosphate-sugar epimerase
MDQALVIGGTRFIGRHLVAELLDHDYQVTLCNRGSHENPFAETAGVAHVEADRTDDAALADAAATDPDVVFDMVAYHPRDVAQATRIFEDVEAYVYVSSGAAYGREELPKREGETPLESCTEEQARSDSQETYGARKAEGDRIVFEAAQDGVRAMSVRPCIVYGPHDYTERLDFWIDRVNRFDRVLVPGDGTNIWHRAYVEDVASALRVVAESGTAGEAYNVGDRRVVTLGELLDLIADCLAETTVTDVESGTLADAGGPTPEFVQAGARELAAADLGLDDYVLYRAYPHLLDTTRLASLGWSSTPLREAMQRSVDAHLQSDRDGTDHGPDRDTEERVLGVLDTL